MLSSTDKLDQIGQVCEDKFIDSDEKIEIMLEILGE